MTCTAIKVATAAISSPMQDATHYHTPNDLPSPPLAVRLNSPFMGLSNTSNRCMIVNQSASAM